MNGLHEPAVSKPILYDTRIYSWFAPDTITQWKYKPWLSEVLSDDIMQRRMRCGLCIFKAARTTFREWAPWL